MKCQINRSVIAAGTMLIGACLVFAQKGGMMYNPATEITVKGAIETVTQGARGQMMGTHLTVKTAEGVQEVILGPSQFVTSKGFSFAQGDAVEVTGSKITMSGKEYVIAREVVKDGKTLPLRDKTGTPAWAGKGMGRRKGPPPSQ